MRRSRSATIAMGPRAAEPCATSRRNSGSAERNRLDTPFSTIRDLLRYAVSRFHSAQLFFGHGSNDAFDEAAYLILSTLKLPLDKLDPFLDAHLLSDEVQAVLKVIERRVLERLPAAYLTNEAWLGGYRFYVDLLLESKRPRRVMTLRSVTGPPQGSANTAASPGNVSGGVSGVAIIPAPCPIESDRRPSSTAMRRSIPGKLEKGPGARISE